MNGLGISSLNFLVPKVSLVLLVETPITGILDTLYAIYMYIFQIDLISQISTTWIQFVIYFFYFDTNDEK